MGPLYLNTLYLQQEGVLSMEAAMFLVVAQTGQTPVRCVQLQHDTSPLNVTKFYTLQL